MINRRLFLTTSTGAVLAAGIPGIAAPKAKTDYLITPRISQASLLENTSRKTTVWAYNGSIPGPVIRARRGEELSIEVLNRLSQPTSIHWHGIRIENAMDGVSGLTQEPIAPGETFTYRFVVPDAGTYWYHPHNRSWEQLARGMYGSLIIEGDATEEAFDRDYTLIADDWRLQDDGPIHEESLGSLRDWSHAGRMGNILTLNGKAYETLPVIPGERVRLRFINTANARILRFAVNNHDTTLIALDGQPVTPVALGGDSIEIAPAQRADIVVDIKGTAGKRIEIVETSNQEPLVAGYLECVEGTAPTRERPVTALLSNKLPQPDLGIAKDVELIMSGGAMRFLVSARYKGEETDGRILARQHGQMWAFNGQAGMDEKPLFSANRGETIKMRMTNETRWPHAIHLHGHHFRVLSRGRTGSDTLEPVTDAEKTAFRDTILLSADESAEIAFVADNPGKWMVHCHMLEHQAAGMATWFEVA